MRTDVVIGGAVVVTAWFLGRYEYLHAKHRYDSMIRVTNTRTRLMVDMSSRINHLRRQRDEAIALHAGDYSRRCVTCDQLFPCQTFQTLRAVEPNIDFP